MKNSYDTFGRIVRSDDVINHTQRLVSYDANGNESRREFIGLDKEFSIDTDFNEKNEPISTRIKLGDSIVSTEYKYADTPSKKLFSATLFNGVVQTPIYDKLGRIGTLKQKKGDITFGKDIYYKQVGDHASELVASEWFEKNGIRKERLAYSYDEKGNITAIKENDTVIVRYTYDSLSRLVREDNKKLDKTTIFAYDNGGNILRKTEYPYTLKNTTFLENGITYNYEYASNGWRDQLISYNGTVCGEYDSLGNPNIYRGKHLIWSHCRQLDSIGNIAFKYNSNGVRIAKIVDGKTTKFYTDGSTIIAQENENSTIFFARGIDGLNGFTLNGIQYFYKRNMQSDIIAIMDANGNEIVHYVYDAWGNHKSYVLENEAYVEASKALNNAYAELAYINPYRYRGYYYDVETGLYYLNSRYYDPEVGRFINADDISEIKSNDIGGMNLYAYCCNNPIKYVDEDGTGKVWNILKWILVGVVAVLAVTAIVVGSILSGGTLAAVLIGAGVGALLGGAYGGIRAAVNGTDIASGILGGAITGAALGAASPLSALGGAGFGIMFGTTFAAGMLSYTVETLGNNQRFDVGNMFISGGLTFLQGALTFGFGKIVNYNFKEGPFIENAAKWYLTKVMVGHVNFIIDLISCYATGNPPSTTDILIKYFSIWFSK